MRNFEEFHVCLYTEFQVQDCRTPGPAAMLTTVEMPAKAGTPATQQLYTSASKIRSASNIRTPAKMQATGRMLPRVGTPARAHIGGINLAKKSKNKVPNVHG